MRPHLRQNIVVDIEITKLGDEWLSRTKLIVEELSGELLGEMLVALVWTRHCCGDLSADTLRPTPTATALGPLYPEDHGVDKGQDN